MKRLLALVLAAACAACGTTPAEPAAHPDWSYNAVVYEMNVRQLTAEGTLRAAAALPALKNTSSVLPPPTSTSSPSSPGMERTAPW